MNMQPPKVCIAFVFCLAIIGNIFSQEKEAVVDSGVENGEEQQTIATVLDHALEAEFNNENISAGKNYNETL